MSAVEKVPGGQASHTLSVVFVPAKEKTTGFLSVPTAKESPSQPFVTDQGTAAQALHCTQDLARSVFADTKAFLATPPTQPLGFLWILQAFGHTLVL